MEYAKRKVEERKHLSINCGTNIECPACCAELLYENFNIQLLSYPPQKTIFCPECNYKTNISV